MKQLRICCVCGQDIGPSNYYRIDGVRFWCIPCGRQWLREPPIEAIKDRVVTALAAYDSAPLVVTGRKARNGKR